MTATWEGAQPLVALAKRWDVKRRQREFDRTITHAEQCAVRRAIRTSQAMPMTKSKREGLAALYNLFFRHRSKSDFIMPGFDKLARVLKVSETTIKRLIRWAEGLGFIIRLRGGAGRGDKCQFGVSIQRLMAVLAPNFSATNGEERVTSDGEVLECKKGVKTISPYIYTKTSNLSRQPYRSPAELFHAGRWTTVKFLSGLIERLAQGYTPRPIQTPPESPHSQAKHEIGGI